MRDLEDDLGRSGLPDQKSGTPVNRRPKVGDTVMWNSYRGEVIEKDRGSFRVMFPPGQFGITDRKHTFPASELQVID